MEESPAGHACHRGTGRGAPAGTKGDRSERRHGAVEFPRRDHQAQRGGAAGFDGSGDGEAASVYVCGRKGWGRDEGFVEGGGVVAIGASFDR